MEWKDVGSKIVSILGPASSIAAPFLSFIPGGALIPTAITAIKAIGAVLGLKDTSPTPDAIIQAIDANPQAAAELARAQLAYEHEVTMQQMAYEAQSRTEQAGINLQDAKSSSIFVSGWRPFIGWVCGAALAYYYVAQPFLIWGFSVFDINTTMPTLEVGELMTLLIGMLGLAGMRSYDKTQEVPPGKGRATG